MPIFSTWSQPRSEFDEFPNRLPNESPATVFQMRFALDFSFAVDFLFASETSLFVGALTGGIPFVGQSIVTKEVSADWKLQILDGQIVIFEQLVTVIIKITAMAFSVFGLLNMGLFVWEPIREVITTTVIDGRAVTPQNPAWSHTLGNTALSEFGTFERGGGSDATDNEGLIIDWWDSPVYKMNIPAGATQKIIKVAVQGGQTSRNLRFEYRFIEAPDIDAFLDRVGAIRSSLPVRNHVYAGHTYYGPKQRSRRDDIATASKPVSWKDRTNRMYWLALRGAAYYLWYSDNEGMLIRPVLYTYEDVSENNPVAVEGSQVALWSDKYTSVDAAPRKQGGFITIAALGSKLYAAFSPDNRSLGPIREIGPHAGGRACTVMAGSTGDGSARYIVTDNVDLQYESSDGLNWNLIDA